MYQRRAWAATAAKPAVWPSVRGSTSGGAAIRQRARWAIAVSWRSSLSVPRQAAATSSLSNVCRVSAVEPPQAALRNGSRGNVDSAAAIDASRKVAGRRSAATTQVKPETRSASPPRERGDELRDPVAVGDDVGVGKKDDLVIRLEPRHRREQIGGLLPLIDREPGDHQRHARAQPLPPWRDRGDRRIVRRFHREDDAVIGVILVEQRAQERIELDVVSLDRHQHGDAGHAREPRRPPEARAEDQHGDDRHRLRGKPQHEKGGHDSPAPRSLEGGGLVAGSAAPINPNRRLSLPVFGEGGRAKARSGGVRERSEQPKKEPHPALPEDGEGRDSVACADALAAGHPCAGRRHTNDLLADQH